MYRRVVTEAIKCSSVVFTATRSTLEGNLALTTKPKDRSSGLEARLLEDHQVIVSSISPKMIVNLSDWTSYFALDGVSNCASSQQEMMVLLEAMKTGSTSHTLSQTDPDKVNVLQHGFPVAWKSGTLFSIVMKCNLDDFVSLGVAFGSGHLTTDDDLQIIKIISIDIEGAPIPLVSKTSNCLQNSHQQQTVAENASLADTSNWSNESLASSNSIADVELLDITESMKIYGRLENGLCSVEESGSGEGLCEAALSSESSSPTTPTPNVKPPNILIYTGKKDSGRKYEDAKKVFEQCLNGDCYVIYHLKHDLVSVTPWVENTCLLVIACDNLYDNVDGKFLSFFQSGGKIVSFGSSFDELLLPRQEVRNSAGIMQLDYKRWKDVSLVTGRYVFKEDALNAQNIMMSTLAADKMGRAVVVEVTGKSMGCMGRAILSQALLNIDPSEIAVTSEMFNKLKKSNQTRFEILRHMLRGLDINCCMGRMPDLTSCFLLAKEEVKSAFLKSIQKRVQDGSIKSSQLSLKLVDNEDDVTGEVTAEILPVVTSTENLSLQYFNQSCYWEHHTCKTLGNCLLYTAVISTTMTILEKLQFSVPEELGMIAIAGRQTSGKGRGGNTWISPVGCAMFTLHVQFPQGSNLGCHASFLQHITSLAVVQSVTTIPGYEDMELKLKWPNDIYYTNEMKLGGVIVQSTVIGGRMHALIGCGFNVTNSNPTICINDLIELHNNKSDTKLPLCSVEQLIARTVSIIELLIEDFQDNGQETFCQKYYKYWLHSGQKVNLQSEGSIDVTILGLDEFGYLNVMAEDGRKISVQPDGNSFDMMHNLITLKTR
ncbi:hypothetical protein ScPMuIL_012264 [Solemya velum]